MITRKEFYLCWGIIAALIIGNIFSDDISSLDLKRAKIDARDSVIQEQINSTLARSLSAELKADSIQALLNRKNLDIQTIKKKTQDEKKNVLILNADSTLSYFLRTTGGN